MNTLPGGLEPPSFRLTAERSNQLRHGGYWTLLFLTQFGADINNCDININIVDINNYDEICPTGKQKYIGQ